MSYQFIDAYASVLTADSSIVSGVVQRPVVNIASVLSPINTIPLGATSIVGGYADGTARTVGDKGIYVLALRNDNTSSIVSTNLGYSPLATDSAGRILTKPFAAGESLIQGVSSTVNIAKSSLLGLSGTGLRTYITDILVSNTGSVATSVSFTDSNGSVIGRTIAPATSGSNIHLATPMRTGSLNSQVEFTAQTAVSVLSVSAYGYIAP